MQDESLFADDPTAGQRTYTVGALTHEIARTMQREFGTEVWVEGEMRNLTRSANGHVYFDLVDPCPPEVQPDATLSIVLFRSTREVVNRYLKKSGGPRMDDGMQVRLRGTLDFYAPQGRLQLRMTGIDPSYMIGRLTADRERILAALRDDNLLDANAQLPIPLMPRRVALVTSAGSAAERDFVSEFERSAIGWHITVVDTRVQGFAAVEGIAAALARAARHGEVIALVRGGGARTDLAAFDSEAVARAIAATPVPVVTGIGHETDTTVADEVASIATKTPTAAASAVVAMVLDVQAHVSHHTHRLAKIATTRLTTADERLTNQARRAHRSVALASRLATNRMVAARQRLERSAFTQLDSIGRTGAVVTDRVQRAAVASLNAHQRTVEATAQRLQRVAPRPIDMAEQRIRRLEDTIAYVDPARLQQRGWSITRTAAGELVRSIDEVSEGERLVTSVTDGNVTSTVTDRNPRGDLTQ